MQLSMRVRAAARRAGRGASRARPIRPRPSTSLVTAICAVAEVGVGGRWRGVTIDGPMIIALAPIGGGVAIARARNVVCVVVVVVVVVIVVV